jgi:hypothetical protein
MRKRKRKMLLLMSITDKDPPLTVKHFCCEQGKERRIGFRRLKCILLKADDGAKLALEHSSPLLEMAH